jgi:serpin B
MKLPLAALLALALTAGCSAAAPSPSGSATAPATGAPAPSAIGPIELAAVSLPRLTTTGEDAAKAGGAVNAFGLDLYARLVAADPEANLVVSPASIQVALAMARAGARGTTASEMDAVMHGLGSDTNAAWVAALDASLNGKDATVKDGAGVEHHVLLRSVNAPFAQQGLPLEPGYLEALSERFGAGLRLVDYVDDTEGARRLINGWVDGQTEARIPELLAPGILTTDTRLTLVNAIYLKAAWAEAFGAASTNPAPFTRLDGTVVQVPTMRGSLKVRHATGPGWLAVELPYIGGSLAMLVIEPDDLRAFEATLDPATLSSITAALEPGEALVDLPAFGAETHAQLGDTLAAMGMPAAFSGAADFSGITSAERLAISAVVHQANIDVDEGGTEAAAATAVVVERVSASIGALRITIDRPFIFALRDLETGAVLFLGRITVPEVRATR